MPAYIDFELQNVDGIIERLAQLAPAAADQGVEAADEYFLGVLYKEIPPYSYVSRAEAYPGISFVDHNGKEHIGYSSQAQWNVVQMLRAQGKIPYERRADGVQSAWHIEGTGRESTIWNSDPAATWVYSENQANLNRLIGWKKVSTLIDQYADRIATAFTRGVNKAIDSLGLG